MSAEQLETLVVWLQQEASPVELSLASLIETIKQRGYDQIVMMVDRDGVLFPDDLFEAARKIAPSPAHELEIFKHILNRRLVINDKVATLLDQCVTSGIDICPASRSEWLIIDLPAQQIMLQNKWLEFLEKRYGLKMTLRRTANEVETSGFRERPFIIFLTDSFHDEEKFDPDSVLAGFLELLKRQLSQFEVARDFLVMNVPCFGRTSEHLGVVEFNKWPSAYDFDQTVLTQLDLFLSGTRNNK